MKLSIGGGRKFGLFLAGLVLLSTLAGGALAANSAINYGADAAQSQQYQGQVTIDTYQMGWDGLQFENDAGEVTDFAGSVNTSVDNPYHYTVTRMDAGDFGAFPHDKANVSALEASEWTATGTGASVSNVQPASGVDAVEMTLSQGDSASFSNFSITSDEPKKTLMMAFDVNSIDAGAEIEVRVNDTDGDYKVAEINTTRSSGEDFMANSTGDGYVFQQQLGQMETVTSTGSDGTFDDIESVDVVAVQNGATVTVTALNLDKNGKYVLGETKTNTDSDDALETETIYENKAGGALAITGLDTLGDTFSAATLHGLTVDFVKSASALPTADVDVSYSDAKSYPSFDFAVDLYYRMSLQTGYDLSYSNVELVATQALPDGRYQTAEIAEGAGDTNFENATYSDFSGSLATAGDHIVIDDTIQPSQTIDVHWNYLVTADEKSALQSGGVMGPTGGSGGGILGSILSIPGMIVTAILGFFGGRKAGWF